VVGNWIITLLTGKEHKLVKEAKRYFLDVVGISSPKHCGSETADLDIGWKLLTSGVGSAEFGQAGAGILVSSVPSKVRNCAIAQYHQTICEMKSHSPALATLQI